MNNQSDALITDYVIYHELTIKVRFPEEPTWTMSGESVRAHMVDALRNTVKGFFRTDRWAKNTSFEIVSAALTDGADDA